MYPVIDNEWLGCKNDSLEEGQSTGNVAKSWQWRERGIDPPHYPTNKAVLENIAEDILVQKQLKTRCCELPGYPRSTFLMVFSPDGTKVASTHGNHNVYVSELASGKHVRILTGHPRTPWCVAFHPSHPQLIGSGCLGGQVRVWDISSGGSEVWNVRNETVIASIAFHPREQLLVIATFNELYFWDWSQPAPLTKVSTNNINEKVRYVAFDSLGYKLITGISLSVSGNINNSLLQQSPTMGPTNNPSSRRDDNDDNPGGNRSTENSGTAQDMIVNSYQNLVQRYDSLVRNYQRLFRVRHRLTNTPPPPSTIDRGTDPMESDMSPSMSGWTRTARPSTSTAQYDDARPSTSRQADNTSANDNATATNLTTDNATTDNGDSEGSSSRLLNLDVLSFDSNPSRTQDTSNQEHSIFGSRRSAFQRLNDPSVRYPRTAERNEWSTRLLPNPFSSSTSTPRPNTSHHETSQSNDNLNSSRTSIFPSSGLDLSLGRDFFHRRRNSSPSQHTTNSTQSETQPLDDVSPLSAARAYSRTLSGLSTSGTNTVQRPTMTNSSTQMSPVSGSVDAQTINESLDLIRDILRDSGTRLLNLITNMSLSTLARMERSMPRRGAQSDDSESGTSGASQRALERFNSILRRDFLSSSSDSDSDQSLELNILRTRNTTFREDESRPDRSTAGGSSDRPSNPTDRMVFVLNDDTGNNGNTENERTSRNPGGINVSLSNNRFRVRTQSANGNPENDAAEVPLREEPSTSSSSRTQNNPEANPRPSTSRDNVCPTGNAISSSDAYRKVRGGVNALQKHTIQLMNLWLRGGRTTMRELRNMWENLRRRILMLHRETGRQNLPGYYTRSLLERCMMLTDMSDMSSRTTSRGSRNGQRGDDSNINTEEGADMTLTSDNTNNSTVTESDLNTSIDSNDNRQQRRSQRRSSPSTRYSSPFRRRLQARWRPEDELRRRTRNPTVNRLATRYSARPRRDFAREIEISATRHEIRMRAMQVLSLMFNMMMMCLEERGLSQLIINMLRTLKKALALTCLMLMSNRNNRAANGTANSYTQNVDSLNVIRIQNVEHSGPVNVDGPDDPSSPATNLVANETDHECVQKRKEESKSSANNKPSTSQSQTKTTENSTREEQRCPPNSVTQRWSNRLAVQIAAANRNTSLTARNRRDLYLECRRQKALHRMNPIAHPISKRRTFPPVSTHRIPALRCLPTRINQSRLIPPRIRPSDEPVAGPSGLSNENPLNQDGSRADVMNEFDQRVNLIRIAHMQAVRLRNAARNRFRRLQTIRLYSPSSVREMFALQSNNSESQPGNRSPLQTGPELSNRRYFTAYRPHILTPRYDILNSPSEDRAQFHAVLNNVALMQANELSSNSEAQENPPNQRVPRIHEYLQPIILAQNAMVVDEEGNGGEGGVGGGGGGPPGGGPRRISGMAGLIDAGIISEALPAPSHRVQAWDFTSGNTPDIADSTKNVVVQRCRIHNDASIDISKDGRLLVALLPVPRLRNSNHWLGVYSLEWSRLGQCLHTAVLEQSAVSVALSPTARHLAVGLGSRRFTTTPHARNNVIALLYRLEPLESSSRTGLSPIKELEHNWEQGFTSLNCLRWAPQPGQGLVYANNTGQLIIMS